MHLMLVLAVGLFFYGVKGHYYRLSDAYLRERIVMLVSKAGQCTGVEVLAPSGKIVTLTAGHCVDVFVDGTATAITEDGQETEIDLLYEYQEADLAVAEGVGDKFVSIAKDIKDLEKVHTMTHGGGQRSYRTDGEIIDYYMNDIPAFEIDSPEKELQCQRSPKMKAGTMPFIFGIKIPVCFLHVKQIISTAKVVPGSSGGPLFNEKNELVGIVSASIMEFFSSYSGTADIHMFLRDK